jgi:hypothetical protein
MENLNWKMKNALILFDFNLHSPHIIADHWQALRFGARI